MKKIKVGAVSYLNTRPLLYGINHHPIQHQLDLLVDYPSGLARQLRTGVIDLALLPVAAIPEVPNAHIISDCGIATDGNVVSVALFSDVPLEEITTVYLDYQSRTSVKLAEILLRDYWKKEVQFIAAHENYIDEIRGTVAGVIIGDRALQYLNRFAHSYDLSAAWKAHTGLDFIFAAWVANRELPAPFIEQFTEANLQGLNHLNEVIATIDYPYYNLHTYYTENIKYIFDQPKKDGLNKFLRLL